MSKVPATTKVSPFQRLIVNKLKLLGPPEEGQVFILELPQDWFARKDPTEVAEIQAFAKALAKASGGHDVFLVPEGRLSVGNPPAPAKLPEIAVPKPSIVLPHGVQI